MSAIKTLADVADEYVRRAADATRKQYKQAVRPIYWSSDGKAVEALGSAVLVRLDGKPCVVTAAHVLDASETGSLHLGGQPTLIPLNMTFEITKKMDGSRHADHTDVAVGVLAPSVAESLEHLGFVAPEHQKDEPAPGEGRNFLVMGYRASQNKTKQITKGELPIKIWTCNVGLTSIPNEALRQFGGELNFGLDYPKIMHRSPAETVSTTPPKGVSGGAIFEICDLEDGDRVIADVIPPPKLVGIFIECRGRVLIGTKLHVVRSMLRRAA